MIQELLGGGGGVGEERKISMNGGGTGGGAVEGSSSSSSSSDHQNLRCPRCDSSNTKFCYYNNYNLTQPRHFCKTCRRYWTKGGALRNVPIGGGCRKNKSTSVPSGGGKSATGKAKTSSPEVGKPNSGNGFDHELPSNPILWAPHQNSQLLALLRATQNPNPNPNSLMIKEEKVMIGSHMAPESAVVTGALNARNLGIDPLTQVPIGLSSSFWRNNHQQQQQQQQHQQLLQNQPQQHSLLMGEVPNTGFQDLYHRLRSTANYYDHSPVALNGATTSSTSSILEPSPVVGGGQLGYWNSPFPWSDLPTTNGAFP
ncbi:hypothetical protein AAC387_Pa02g3448 [Persea americana]|eukprot:TRINITY_DN3258_c2_g1_i1.p1 TRINITY_DN3258_c2_g1~~TRINITY_DN3258_c2_g1_i1.p1  ORF type:complete len:313 (-),score=57.60 TRINITY_DN3258_c2_g1_i1:353-1291(-)